MNRSVRWKTSQPSFLLYALAKNKRLVFREIRLELTDAVTAAKPLSMPQHFTTEECAGGCKNRHFHHMTITTNENSGVRVTVNERLNTADA